MKTITAVVPPTHSLLPPPNPAPVPPLSVQRPKQIPKCNPPSLAPPSRPAPTPNAVIPPGSRAAGRQPMTYPPPPNAPIAPQSARASQKAPATTPNHYHHHATPLNGLRSALEILYCQVGVPNIVISSLLRQPEDIPLAFRAPEHPTNAIYTPDTLLCLCSSLVPGGDQISRVHTITVPKIRGYFSGVGDLLSALVLAHFDPTESGESPLSIATARAVNTTHAVLLNTQNHYAELPEDDRPDTDVEKDKQDVARRPKRMKARELRIIQSLDVIRAGVCEPVGNMVEWSDFWTAKTI